MSVVICENDEKAKSLLNNPPACLKQLIHIKPISKETIDLAKRLNINTLSFSLVERFGVERKYNPMVCFAHCYTSYILRNAVRTILFLAASKTGRFVYHLLHIWNNRQPKGSHVDP